MSIARKKRNYASNALLYAIFVAGAVVLINLIGMRLFGRLDTTEKRIYTLSKPSKDLVKNLPDYLTVKAFISNDLPPEITRLSRDMRDKLEDYQAASNGRFRWEATDPEWKPIYTGFAGASDGGASGQYFKDSPSEGAPAVDFVKLGVQEGDGLFIDSGSDQGKKTIVKVGGEGKDAASRSTLEISPPINTAQRNLKYRVVKAADLRTEEEVSRCKVNKIQVQKITSGKFELGSYYLGLCLQYGDKTEAIPQVVNDAGLEYQLSSLIKKMTVKKKKISLTTGHGEADFNQGFRGLKDDIEQEYDVVTVNPSSAEIAPDTDTLIIGAPKQPIDEKGLKEIDRFLMTGKGAVILAPGMIAQGAGARGMENIKMLQSNDTGLAKLLEPYGFKIPQEIVIDPPAAQLGVLELSGGRVAPVTLPAFVGARTEKAPGNSVLEGLRGVIFPYASPVELVGPLANDHVPAGGKLQLLAASTRSSYKHSGFAMISPEMKFDPAGKEFKSYALGYMYQGPLKSAFVSEPAASVSSPDKQPVAESQKPVRLVVIGDAAFAGDEWLRYANHPLFMGYQNGALLLYNAIGWTVEDEALIPLRSKTMDSRQLPPLTETTASLVQWLNILGLPMAFCLFGVIYWLIRRSKRANQTL